LVSRLWWASSGATDRRVGRATAAYCRSATVKASVDCLGCLAAPRLRNLQVRTTVWRRNGAPAQHAGRCQLTHSVSTRCTSPPCEIAPNADSARWRMVPVMGVAAHRSCSYARAATGRGTPGSRLSVRVHVEVSVRDRPQSSPPGVMMGARPAAPRWPRRVRRRCRRPRPRRCAGRFPVHRQLPQGNVRLRRGVIRGTAYTLTLVTDRYPLFRLAPWDPPARGVPPLA
jgi:hypothetical protein